MRLTNCNIQFGLGFFPSLFWFVGSGVMKREERKQQQQMMQSNQILMENRISKIECKLTKYKYISIVNMYAKRFGHHLCV